MPWSYRNTARGTIPTIPAAQCFTQTVEWDAEKNVSHTNCWLQQCLENWAVSDPEQRKQAGFTYCQSSCAVLLGWPAQSDQPLSSWPQIHFGFCLQSSPPSRWCSRCSLVGRFAGAPLKWEKMLVNGQVWKRENLMLDNLSLKISQLPGTLDLHLVFLSNLSPNLSSSALIQWLVSIQAPIFSLLTVREEKARKKKFIFGARRRKSLLLKVCPRIHLCPESQKTWKSD